MVFIFLFSYFVCVRMWYLIKYCVRKKYKKYKARALLIKAFALAVKASVMTYFEPVFDFFHFVYFEAECILASVLEEYEKNLFFRAYILFTYYRMIVLFLFLCAVYVSYIYFSHTLLIVDIVCICTFYFLEVGILGLFFFLRCMNKYFFLLVDYIRSMESYYLIFGGVVTFLIGSCSLCLLFLC